MDQLRVRPRGGQTDGCECGGGVVVGWGFSTSIMGSCSCWWYPCHDMGHTTVISGTGMVNGDSTGDTGVVGDGKEIVEDDENRCTRSISVISRKRSRLDSPRSRDSDVGSDEMGRRLDDGGHGRGPRGRTRIRPDDVDSLERCNAPRRPSDNCDIFRSKLLASCLSPTRSKGAVF